MTQVPKLEPTILKGPINFTDIRYFLHGAHKLAQISYVRKNFNNYAKNIGTTVQNLVTWVTRQPEFVYPWRSPFIPNQISINYIKHAINFVKYLF
jgi:hypothetical protein